MEWRAGGPEPAGGGGAKRRDDRCGGASSSRAHRRRWQRGVADLAFFVLLETLFLTERAVFLLRDVFDYDYPEIARLLGKNEAACRQLASRAHRRIESGKPALRYRATSRTSLPSGFSPPARMATWPG